MWTRPLSYEFIPLSLLVFILRVEICSGHLWSRSQVWAWGGWQQGIFTHASGICFFVSLPLPAFVDLHSTLQGSAYFLSSKISKGAIEKCLHFGVFILRHLGPDFQKWWEALLQGAPTVLLPCIRTGCFVRGREELRSCSGTGCWARRNRAGSEAATRTAASGRGVE